MFGIQDVLSGEYFDTKDVTVSYVLKSPVFRGDDNSDGSLVFDMTLPATDKNKKLTGFLDRIEKFPSTSLRGTGTGNVSTSLDKTLEIAVYGWLNGQQVWSGTMVAKFARPGEIECSIGLGRGEFNYLAKDKQLKDVVPDEEHVVGHVESVQDVSSGIWHDLAIIDGFDDVPGKVYPEVNFAMFPMKIVDAWASLGAAFNNAYYNVSATVNTWDMDLQKFMAPLLTGDQYLLINSIAADPSNNNTNILTYLLAYNIFLPQVYNAWVFKNLWKLMGFFLENNPFETDEDLKRLTIYNIQALNKLFNEFEEWQGNPNTKRYLYELRPNTEFNLKDHLPDIAVKDYLRALEDLFFFRCFIDNKTKRVKIKFLKDVINCRDYADVTDRVSGVKERKLEFDKISALIQVYDSADSNSENLKAASDIEALVRIPDVNFKEDLPVNTFGQYENKICYVIMERKFYQCSAYADDFNHVSQWDEFAYEYYLRKYCNDTGKEWSVDASGIVGSYYFDYRPGSSYVKWEWLLPFCKMPMKFYNASKTKDNKCGLRLQFYRGMQDGKTQIWSPQDNVRITPGRDQVARDSIGDVIKYADLPPEVLHTLSQYWEEVNYSNKFRLIDSIKDFIIYNLLQGAYEIHYVMTYLYPILGNQRRQWLIQNYCEIVYVAPPQATSVITKKYPLGTSDVYDAFGTKIPEANLSLKWEGQYGIYERFAKTFVEWKNERAKAVTFYFQPEAKDLSFDFSKKYRVNGIDYLIDEIRGEIRGDGTLGVAEVDGFSC